MRTSWLGKLEAIHDTRSTPHVNAIDRYWFLTRVLSYIRFVPIMPEVLPQFRG